MSRDFADDEVRITRHNGTGKTWDADATQGMAIVPSNIGLTPEDPAFYDPYKTQADSENPKGVWGTQVGGNHYSKYAIQPAEYIIKNKLNFCEGNVIKYVTRYKDKNGVEDLRKARHYLDILISELEGDVARH